MKNNINKVLKEKDMTQGHLAEMVGIKREYLNRIINHKISTSLEKGLRQ